MGWLDGKRALIAGAGSGIGRAVLDAFAAEGAQVGALERDPAKAARLTDERPDCVVSDLKMPGMTGLELLEKAREIDDGLPLIVMTAYGAVDTAVEATGMVTT